VKPVLMVGWSHRRSPLALLEQLTVRRGDEPGLLGALRLAGYVEAVVLSTCSRTELYAVAGVHPSSDLVGVLAEYAECPRDQLDATAERRGGRDAVEHLFRVTSGLESRVIGEVEIAGQVRAALRAATRAGATGATLTRLFAAAAQTGARVRERTTLGSRGRSLSCQAVELGLAAVGVAEPVVVVVGAGRMASTAVEHLTRLDRRPQVAARDERSAARLAGADRVCPLPALAAAIEQADLVICATSAAQWVVTSSHVRTAMTGRRARPLTLVDLSVPRNIDVSVAALPGVRLIDLESMNDDWAHDPELCAAVATCSAIVEQAVADYTAGLAIAGAGPIIAALRREVEATCLRELTRSLGARAVAEPDLARAAHAVAGKLLHRPTLAARTAAASGDTGLLRRLCEVLGVSEPSPFAAGCP
jgi:glutamyl-tRNA reductase